LKQRDRTKGIAARTGRCGVRDNNVRDRMKSPSMIELYLSQPFIYRACTESGHDRREGGKVEEGRV